LNYKIKLSVKATTTTIFTATGATRSIIMTRNNNIDNSNNNKTNTHMSYCIVAGVVDVVVVYVCGLVLILSVADSAHGKN